MRRVRFLVAVASLLVLLSAIGQGTLAQEANPLGGPSAPPALNRPGLGPKLTSGDLDGTALAQPVCMVDVYGIAYDAVITRDWAGGPGHYTIAGTSDPGSGWDWLVTGWIQKYKNPISWVQYWRLENPYADGCMSGWVDYADINASGAKFAPAGTFTSYCSGSPMYQDPGWTGTVYKGACP